MKRSLLMLSVAFVTLVASAQNKVEIEGIWYNLDESTLQAEVTYKGDYYYSYDEYSGSINIPATVTHEGVDYSVTSIGEWAFYNCSSLAAINIPGGVTSIGSYAFGECESLTTITIPASMTSIGDDAFSSCKSLTTITIPESVTSIGESAFYYCRSLTSITIPDNSQLTSIGKSAFSNCESLTTINIPKGVTSIGDYAFSSCKSLTTIIVAEGNDVYDSRDNCNAIIATESNTLIQGCNSTTIPKGVTSIGDYALCNCSSLTAITIPEGVTSIGDGAFSWCSSLTTINIPEGVTSIGDFAFQACSSLTAITIPEGVTGIGDYAFDGCESLTAITIPEGVTSIGERAFSGCESLTAITIPENVTNIGYYAFDGCILAFDNFTNNSICVDNNFWGATLRDKEIDGLLIDNNIVVDCRASVTTTTIPEGVTGIGDYAFCNCSRLTAITIPESVTSIGESAFYGCESLTTITIPEGVTSIESGAFYGCPNLRDVYCYAEEVPSAENFAFYGSFPEDATLHVPANALEAYKTAAPWSSFGTIVALEDEEDGILTIPAKPVLISTQGVTITVSGLAAGTEVTVYSTAGSQLATAESADGTATLNTDLTAGNIAVVKIGEHSIKVAIK